MLQVNVLWDSTLPVLSDFSAVLPSLSTQDACCVATWVGFCVL